MTSAVVDTNIIVAGVLTKNPRSASRKVGSHRRVLFEDVLAYKRDIDNKRLKVLEELSALDQELALG